MYEKTGFKIDDIDVVISRLWMQGIKMSSEVEDFMPVCFLFNVSDDNELSMAVLSAIGDRHSFVDNIIKKYHPYAVFFISEAWAKQVKVSTVKEAERLAQTAFSTGVVQECLMGSFQTRKVTKLYMADINRIDGKKELGTTKVDEQAKEIAGTHAPLFAGDETLN